VRIGPANPEIIFLREIIKEIMKSKIYRPVSNLAKWAKLNTITNANPTLTLHVTLLTLLTLTDTGLLQSPDVTTVDLSDQ